MTQALKPPAVTATNSLKRWCLRALHQSCDSMLHNAMHSRQGLEPLEYARHQGPPPLRFSCIAPHCEEWCAIDESTGYCCYRQRIAMASATARMQAAAPAGA